MRVLSPASHHPLFSCSSCAKTLLAFPPISRDIFTASLHQFESPSSLVKVQFAIYGSLSVPWGADLVLNRKNAKSFALYATFRRVNMKVATANWVLINKFCELKGYTDDAVRAKIKRGEWEKNRLWRKAPDNRIVIDVNAVNQWMGAGNA